MKSTIIGTTLAILALAITASAASNDQSEIKATYAKIQSALKNKDLNAIEALEAPNYTETNRGKTYKRDKANELMAQEMAAIKSVSKLSLHVVNIKVQGKKAHATSSFEMVCNVDQGGKNRVLKVNGKTEDTLVKTSKGWLFESEKDLAESATLDGKPMTMNGG